MMFQQLQHASAILRPISTKKSTIYNGRKCGAGTSVDLKTQAQKWVRVVRQSVRGEGLVLPVGDAGSWDEAAVGSPVVRCFVGDNEERWVMWYSGRRTSQPAADEVASASGSVGIAVSSDGIDWSRGYDNVSGMQGEDARQDVGFVLEPNKDWWTFDTCHISVSDVQMLSNNSVNNGLGVYWMFYSGGSFEAVPAPQNAPWASSQGDEALEGVRMRPGLALSQDGRNWARVEGDHHTGAIFDVGPEGTWDELYIGRPSLLISSRRDLRLFYHSYDVRCGRYIIGLATSRDGLRWEKKGPVFDPGAKASTGAFDARGAAGQSVIYDDVSRRFLMFYEAVAADGTRSIGLATSSDGLTTWERCDAPVLSPSGEAGAWDSGSVGAPSAVPMAAGRWRLYYSGRPTKETGPWKGIGMSLSVDSGRCFNGAPAEFKRRKESKVLAN